MALLASTLITDLQDEIGELSSAAQTVLLKYVQRALDRVYQHGRWSWRRVTGQFTTQAPYTTGTVTASAGSTSVTGSGSTWTGITDYDVATFYFGVNNVHHLVASIDGDTGLTLTAGVDAALSGDTYSLRRPVYPLATTFSEITYLGTEGQPPVLIEPPGLCHEIYQDVTEQTYAERAALTTTLNDTGTKYRQIILWPFPSELRVYHYEGYRSAPTLTTATDLGTPDDFKSVVEELTMALWWRRRDNNDQRAQGCMAEGMRLLGLLYGDDAKGSGKIAFRGGQRRSCMPAFRADTNIWRG